MRSRGQNTLPHRGPRCHYSFVPDVGGHLGSGVVADLDVVADLGPGSGLDSGSGLGSEQSNHKAPGFLLYKQYHCRLCLLRSGYISFQCKLYSPSPPPPVACPGGFKSRARTWAVALRHARSAIPPSLHSSNSRQHHRAAHHRRPLHVCQQTNRAITQLLFAWTLYRFCRRLRATTQRGVKNFSADEVQL